MKPSLPPKVSTSIDRISAATWNRLIDCLAYGMSHPRGDGHTIFNRLGDLLSTGRSSSSGSGGSSLVGFFRVTDNGDGILTVGSGYVNRNGLEVIEFKGGTIDAQTGTLCICTEPIDKAGKWSDISLKFITPNPCAYPIAKITYQGEEVTIEQYPVTVAMIFRSKRCPIAKM